MTALIRDIPELASYAGKSICMPVTPRIARTRRLRKLMDLPLFQRLRSVRQLALAHMVYPGAMHTRFEHSLGAYSRVCQYIAAISSEPPNLLTPPHATSLMLAALLHDCGHYPLAHSFEEMLPKGAEQDYKHDRTIVRILQGDVPAVLSSEERGNLNDLLIARWGTTLDNVCAIISGLRIHATKDIDGDMVVTLHSFLDGPLDADKLDYLQRDSHHTGNPAGMGIDEARLVAGLIIDRTNNALAIKERALPAAQSMAHARYSMFVTVYWHRTNRAMDRMFSQALTYLMTEAPSEFRRLYDERVFTMDDEQVLSWVGRRIPEEFYLSLIDPLLSTSNRRSAIYQRVVTVPTDFEAPKEARVDDETRDLHSRICELYDRFLLRTESWRWTNFETELRESLANEASADPHEVLIDIPDPRFETPRRDEERKNYPDRTNDFAIVDSKGRPAGTAKSRSALFGDFLDGWRKNARKVRIFAQPDAAVKLAARKGYVVEELDRLSRHWLKDSTFEPGRPPY